MAFSSIDPAYLAKQYTQIERAGKDKVLKTQQDRFSGLISSFKKLETSLSSMQDMLKKFTTEQDLLSNTGKSSSEEVLAIKTSGKAVAGDYEIFVQQLAQRHQLSLSFQSTDLLPVNGQLELTVAGKAFAVDLASLPAGSGISALSDAINKKADNSGVQATVMRSGSQSFLVLTSKDSGAAKAVSLNFVPGADTSGANLSAAVAAATELKAAQDAIVKVGAQNPITVTSDKNELTDVINGVTLELKKVQAGAETPVKVTVKQDPAAVEEKLKKFVDSYNALMKQMNSDTALNSDSMARAVGNQLRQGFQKSYQGSTLTAIGLEFDRNGVLSLNKTKLEKALADNPARLEQMLVADNSLFSGLKQVLEPYTKRFGVLKDKQQSLQGSLDMVKTKQKRHEYSMDLVYKRYLAQFTQMQTTIAQLEGSMSQFGTK
jgi:flagellar hook-associated protein 2